jgi:hypothetical protein
MQRSILMGIAVLLCLTPGVALRAQNAPSAEPLTRLLGLDGSGRQSELLSTLWALPNEDDVVTLLTLGQDQPTTVRMYRNTILIGKCRHNGFRLEFRPREAGKKCDVCPCAASAVECITGADIESRTWEEMLQRLPRGTALRAIYRVNGRPEAGLQGLVVDRRTVLLPVVGLNNATTEQLLALVKPIGGTGVQWAGNERQLVITLKEDWTPGREVELEKRLAQIGAKTPLPPGTAARMRPLERELERTPR